MLGTAIGIWFAQTYAMNTLESDFLKPQKLTPLLWYCYIDDPFFIWTHGEGKLTSSLNVLNNYHPDINFTNEPHKEHISSLDLNVKLSENKLSTDLYFKSTDRLIIIFTVLLQTQNIRRNLFFTGRLWDWVVYVQKKKILINICEMKSWHKSLKLESFG